MQQKYTTPQARIFLFRAKEPVALLEEELSDPEHDNGYIDWFSDADADRRNTKD